MQDQPPYPIPAYPPADMIAYDEPERTMGDYVAMFRRRKVQILLTVAALALGTVLAAMLLPATYRSTATILVQEQEIPPEFVRSTVTSYADERISVISQQVMTRAVLLGLIDKYNLYGTRRQFAATEEILDRMRKDIKITTINANVTDRRGGGQVNATIAFQIAYDSNTPENAQRIVNDLVSLFLSENLKSRQKRAEEANAFLSEETERLGAHISEMEAKLADFKGRNQGKLPEGVQANQAALDRAEAEVLRIDRDISAAADRRAFLETQIAQARATPSMVSGATGAAVERDPNDRLQTLQTQYASLSGAYSEQHPDLVRLRREITALKKEAGVAGFSDDQLKMLEERRSDLAQLREKYSSDHPDVQRAARAVAALEQQQREADKAAAARPRKAADRPPTRVENPVLLTLRAQAEAANSEIKQLRSLRGSVQAKIAQIERRIEAAPAVEKEYLDLVRDHENALSRYKELKAKQMQAEVAESLEKDRRAERFSLIDPPQLPERPQSPNRPLILIAGMLLSLGSGVGIAAVREGLDRSVKGSRELARLVSVPVLGVIPYVETPTERRKRNATVKFSLLLLAAAGVLTIVFIHYFVIQLPVLWYIATRKFGMG